MKYEFKPIEFSISKQRRPKLYININVSSYNYCTSSHGIFIFIQLGIFKHISLCLMPIGNLSTIK